MLFGLPGHENAVVAPVTLRRSYNPKRTPRLRMGQSFR